MFHGYSTQSKGYKIWDFENSKIVVSQDVNFHETQSDQSVVNTNTVEAEPRNFDVLGREDEVKAEDSIDFLEEIHLNSTSLDKVHEQENTADNESNFLRCSRRTRAHAKTFNMCSKTD